MLELKNHFTGTYAKNLLADWSVISDFIRQKATWVKDTVHNQTESNSLKLPTLTDQQINDAFNGPFQHFFKTHLRAYSQISKVEAALAITKEDLFKDAEQAIETPFGLEQSFLAKMEFSTLKELRAKLDALTKEHYAQWELNIQSWSDTLKQAFKENNLMLSDLELQEFSINQPISELHDQFINLKITLPKLPKSEFDFQQYFTLAMTLIIRNALTHALHGEKEIDQWLKILKPAFKNLNETEQALLLAQAKSLNELMVAVTPKK